MELQKKKSPRGLLLLSFLLPLLLSLLSFALERVAPFGDYTLLRSDAWAQYHPYLSLFRDTLLRGGSLEHTWSIGMGINFLPMIAYYLSSPLYLLSVLVPEALLTHFMLLLTVVKLGLAGLFFTLFLRYAYGAKERILPFFALLYSLCAWSAGYYWNIIWLDVFALLPLLITGTLALLREGRYRVYVLSLALCFWCNYYLSFCCCIFVLLSFLGYQVCRWKGAGALIRTFLRFGLCTVLALALSAALLIPTLMGMQNTSSIQTTEFSLFALSLPTGSYEFSFSAFLQALSQTVGRTLTNSQPTYMEGLPNLFSGFSALILAFSFLCNPSFSRRDRIFHGGLLLLFVLSCIFKLPDYVWHGFRFPNMIPWRFTFLFSFTVVTMAYRGYVRLHRLGWKRLLLSALLGFCVVLSGLASRRALSLGIYSLAMILAVFAGTLLALVLGSRVPFPRGNGPVRKRLCALLFALLFLGEAFLSIYSGVDSGISQKKALGHATMGQELSQTLKDTDPELFYRTEFAHNGTSNDGAILHYNGVDVFSSAALVNAGNFASALGIQAWPESNSTTYQESAPFTHTLCGIKYLIGRKGEFLAPENTVLVDSGDEYELRSLSSYIGVGFMTDRALADFASLEANKNPFEEQAELFRLATGLEGELYQPIYNPRLEASEGCSLETTDNNSQFLYKVADHLSSGTFTLRYIMEQAGSLCMATRMASADGLEVYKNGELILTTEVDARGILALGQVVPGDVVELVYTSDSLKEAGINLYMAYHNDALLQQGLDLLSDEVWNVTYADDTTLKGTVTALKDGLFYSSIPYEPGWTVTVDGKEVPVATGYDPGNKDVKLTDALIAFPLSAGDHEILMTYHTPGLTAGVLVSLCAVTALVLLVLFKKETILPDPIPTEKE